MANILLIGTGGCGNTLINDVKKYLNQKVGLSNIYDIAFINNNREDFASLEYRTKLNSCAIEGTGSGTNAQVAKKSLQNDKSKFLNFILKKVNDSDLVYIVSSSDGGFGNGTILTIAEFIRTIMPKVGIGLLIANPAYKVGPTRIANTLRLYEEISKTYKSELERINKEKQANVPAQEIKLPVFNSVQFIDNRKCSNDSMEEFNKLTIELFIESLELKSKNLDETDMLLVNSTHGYRGILPVSDSYRRLSDAIEKAALESPFLLPSEFFKDDEHEYLDLKEKIKVRQAGAVFKTRGFVERDFLECFSLKSDKYKVAIDDNGNNMIVLAGINFPDNEMYKYNLELDRLLEESKKEEMEEMEKKAFTFENKFSNNNDFNISIQDKEDDVEKLKRAKAALGADFFKI